MRCWGDRCHGGTCGGCRCSECRGAMHKQCFVGHYHVVPGRRDWTYCPAHSLSLQVDPPPPPESSCSSLHAPQGKPASTDLV